MAVKKSPAGGRGRAGFPAAAVAFLITALVFYLATVSVREEKTGKAVIKPAYDAREITLNGGTYWFVALGNAENAEACRILCARYTQRGAAGYQMIRDGRHLCIGNVYIEEEEAGYMAQKITKEGIEAEAFSVSEDNLILRFSADLETLDALDEIIKVLGDSEKALLSVSERLDAGTLSKREAGAILSVIRYDLGVREEYAKKSGAAKTVGAVMNLYLDALSDADGLLTEAGGEMILSARIKHCVIRMIDRRLALISELSD